MYNSEDKVSATIAPSRASKIRMDSCIRPEQIAIALQNNESAHDLAIFRKLMNIKSRLEDPKTAAAWNPVMVELLRIITASDDVGCEQVLLASLALINLSFRALCSEHFERRLSTWWSMKGPILQASGRDFNIRDVEWFKLAITHGYLRSNIETIYADRLMSLPFEILRRNCLRYTKYSYFAHKTLQVWLNKSATTNFWRNDRETSIEKDLESIIFSNWDSSILEIAQINSTQIFSTYLRIMTQKYNGFLDYIFENCMKNLSWQNELKYTILTEVCKIWNDLTKISSSELPSCLFTSLTKNHLKYPGTKLYLTILGKLKANEWQEIFGESLFRISAIWESEERTTAIDLLWERWMQPTIVKFPIVFEFLWEHDSASRLKINRSYLEKIGDRHGFQLVCANPEIGKILLDRIINTSEPVRLNAFAILCQLQNFKITTENYREFFIVAMKKFLFLSMDTSSIFMRKGIVKNFEIFFANVVRLAPEADSKDPENDFITRDCSIIEFFSWLHEFLLDCFGSASSYQRKILALSLYEIVLIPTSFEDCRMGLWNVSSCNPERRKFINCAMNFRSYLDRHCRSGWMYCNSESARAICSLVYDPMNDVRDKAALMLCQYFDKHLIPAEELQRCWDKNEYFCRSVMVNDIEIGVAGEKLRNLWGITAKPPHYNDRLPTVVSHIRLARSQLCEMQNAAIEHNKGRRPSKFISPVYGSLMMILEVGFLIGPVDKIYDESVVRKILDLAEDVTKFGLSAVSPKCDQTKWPSSFNDIPTEYPFTLDDPRENGCLEPLREYQIFLLCVWMSIKISSEIAAELGLIAETEEIARRSVDLIVSVLLKCRHKGAIEAAGSALAKLTKSLSRTNNNRLIESHLTDLLNMGDEYNIDMTRRGAGFTIMFHRIVSSDGRRNKPWLHMAVKKLLVSLEMNNDDAVLRTDRPMDFAKARHLHFLRSLVADKELQYQLLPYIEEICLACFRYLRSSEWTVRNASLQLFGAIVPRLVGQCNARELDYGIGNSVEHFVTHYPIIAKTVMERLRRWKNLCSGKIEKNSVNGTIVPILTLLSKMSSGGCELVDYSSKEYSSEARNIFVALFDHPVINVRVLAGKAYAAFVPFPEIRRELAELQITSFSVDESATCNRVHGRLSAQLYLERKLNHESQCTSETFFHRNPKNLDDIVCRGTCLQFRLLGRIVCSWAKRKERNCYTVVSALIACLLESPFRFSEGDLPIDWRRTRVAIGQTIEERSKPGFPEFLENLMSLAGELRVVAHGWDSHSDVFDSESHFSDHRPAAMKNIGGNPPSVALELDEAEATIDDYDKSNTNDRRWLRSRRSS